MKVLFLVQKEQRAILDRLYEGVSAFCDCDVRWLSGEEQSDLKKYFRDNVHQGAYDRVLIFLRFKKEIRQSRFLRSIPNLVFLEHDAYQNYIPGKYRGCFSAHYRRLPGVRVISSGYAVVERLRKEGVDAAFVSKGYDQMQLRNLGRERDIELAFVGSLKSGVYSERKAFLDALVKVEPLQVTKTNSGNDYLHVLNRIRYFVSADIGMGEYMIKNFEAMACGCLLFAYDQGVEENKALGLIDMENIILYRSLEEFRAKLEFVRGNPGVAEEIADRGCCLAESNFRFSRLGEKIVNALQPPLRDQHRNTAWQTVKSFLKF